MVESTVAAARDEERKLEQLLFAPPTEGTVVASIDAAKAQQFDAILVLGGGVRPRRASSSRSSPRAARPPQRSGARPRQNQKYCACRPAPRIVPSYSTLEGLCGLRGDGAGREFIDAGVDEQDVFVETTSFDTRSATRSSRGPTTARWRAETALIITSEFHMDGSRANVWKSKYNPNSG